MRRRSRLVLLAAVVVLVIPLAASAATSRYIDVSDDNVFVHDINWMAANEITRGCNPPANTMYCPGDHVTRQQMAAFIHRVSVNRVVDAGTLDGKNSKTFAADMEWVVESKRLTLSPDTEKRVTVTCPRGKVPIGGGGLETASLFAMVDNYPQSDGWSVSWLNLSNSEESGNVRIYAMCVSGDVGGLPFAAPLSADLDS